MCQDLDREKCKFLKGPWLALNLFFFVVTEKKREGGCSSEGGGKGGAFLFFFGMPGMPARSPCYYFFYSSFSCYCCRSNPLCLGINLKIKAYSLSEPIPCLRGYGGTKLLQPRLALIFFVPSCAGDFSLMSYRSSLYC